MGNAYRSAYDHIIATRLAEVSEERELVAPFLPRLRSIAQARVARAIAGGIGIAGAGALAVAAIETRDAAATEILVGSVGAMGAMFLAARLGFAVVRAFGPPRVAPLALEGELTRDLARIDANEPHARIGSRLANLELWSTALPLIAMSLLAPLTIHWAFMGLVGNESDRSFSEWIRISLVIVGHAHLALAAFSFRFARKMSVLSDEDLARMPIHREWLQALGLTVLVAAVPGLALLAVPPLLTAVTGLLFVPPMFLLMRDRVLRERRELAITNEAARRSSPANPG